jgi:hypothetical protein
MCLCFILILSADKMGSYKFLLRMLVHKHRGNTLANRYVMAYVGKRWRTLADFGRLWQTLADVGKFWQTLANFDSHVPM